MMFRKIIMIVLSTFLLVSSVLAIDPTRWKTLLDTDENKMYIDLQTIKYNPSTNVATYWMRYSKKIFRKMEFEPILMRRCEMNFNTKVETDISEVKCVNGHPSEYEQPITFSVEGVNFYVFPDNQPAKIIAEKMHITPMFKDNTGALKYIGESNMQESMWLDCANTVIDKNKKTALAYVRYTFKNGDTARWFIARCDFNTGQIDKYNRYSDSLQMKMHSTVPESDDEKIYNAVYQKYLNS